MSDGHTSTQGINAKRFYLLLYLTALRTLLISSLDHIACEIFRKWVDFLPGDKVNGNEGEGINQNISSQSNLIIELQQLYIKTVYSKEKKSQKIE